MESTKVPQDRPNKLNFGCIDEMQAWNFGNAAGAALFRYDYHIGLQIITNLGRSHAIYVPCQNLEETPPQLLQRFPPSRGRNSEHFVKLWVKVWG